MPFGVRRGCPIGCSLLPNALAVLGVVLALVVIAFFNSR